MKTLSDKQCRRLGFSAYGFTITDHETALFCNDDYSIVTELPISVVWRL